MFLCSLTPLPHSLFNMAFFQSLKCNLLPTCSGPLHMLYPLPEVPSSHPPVNSYFLFKIQINQSYLPSLNKQLRSAYHIPGTILGTGDLRQIKRTKFLTSRSCNLRGYKVRFKFRISLGKHSLTRSKSSIEVPYL